MDKPRKFQGHALLKGVWDANTVIDDFMVRQGDKNNYINK